MLVFFFLLAWASVFDLVAHWLLDICRFTAWVGGCCPICFDISFAVSCSFLFQWHRLPMWLSRAWCDFCVWGCASREMWLLRTDPKEILLVLHWRVPGRCSDVCARRTPPTCTVGFSSPTSPTISFFASTWVQNLVFFLYALMCSDVLHCVMFQDDQNYETLSSSVRFSCLQSWPQAFPPLRIVHVLWVLAVPVTLPKSRRSSQCHSGLRWLARELETPWPSARHSSQFVKALLSLRLHGQQVQVWHCVPMAAVKAPVNLWIRCGSLFSGMR